jgi:hypothetical protein
MTDDLRLFAPATARNREPIRAVLADILPTSGLVLEVASGSGEHVMHLAAAFPKLRFQPSDPSEPARRSIAAWTAETGLGNILPPLDLDASLFDASLCASSSQAASWPRVADAVLCINMIHISPWSATIGLITQAASILPPGAPLYLYGPYQRNGAHTAPSNAAFDADLRSRNEAWGVRDLDAVAALAASAGFAGPQVIEMPANNLSVIFHRQGIAAH